MRRGLLGDALWGQYCLFKCIRLQDDVFDGHATDLTLVYAADLFLVEAERAFAPHFPRRSPFWTVFWPALESTARAIVTVDALQRRPGCDPARLAREYARVAAVLKVGAAAVCLGHRRAADAAALDALADEWAIADQILDDLDDVADDLRRGRFNYVAQRLCRGRGADALTAAEARRAVARALARGGGADRVLDDAGRRFARAARAARDLGVPAVAELTAAGSRAVDARRRAFLGAQARLAFGRG